MKKSLLFAALLFSQIAFGQSAIIRGEASAGTYENLKSTSGVLQTIVNSGIVGINGAADPCLSNTVSKSSAVINISTAATTALVAPSGAFTIYVCDFSFTISQVVTTANTLKFVQGTGAACVTGQSDLTGLFGAGGVTAGIPITVTAASSGSVFKTAASGGLCATTAIGASAAFQGVLTFVQQ